MRGFIIGIVALAIIGAIGGYTILKSGLIPANADATPSALEQWVAQTSLDATISREAPKGPNPVKLTDVNLIKGIHLYTKNCAICHGDYRGDASETPIAKGQYIKPPQLATDGVEDDPMGFTFWKVKHGMRWTAMPAWTNALTDRQIWTLALFLKHMDKLPPAAQQVWQQAVNGPVVAPVPAPD